MSARCTALAAGATGLMPEVKLALLAVADAASHPAGAFSIPLVTVAIWADVSEESAMALLADLVKADLLSIFPQEDARIIEGVFMPEMDVAIRKKGGRPSRKWSVSPEVKAAVLERDGHRCHYCRGEGEMTLDHIIPQAAGGKATVDNLVAACRPCNSSKGLKGYDEFKLWLRLRGRA